MTTPTPRTDALVRKLEAEIRANAKGTPMEDPASQAIDALADCERDLAAAQDRAERTEVWAHGLEADMDKLREELAAAQEENAKLKAEITRVMQAAANGGYCRRNHAKCECENIAESIRTDE